MSETVFFLSYLAAATTTSAKENPLPLLSHLIGIVCAFSLNHILALAQNSCWTDMGGEFLFVYEPTTQDSETILTSAVEWDDGFLTPIESVDQGQLPRLSGNMSFRAAKVRDAQFRDAPDGPRRDDVVAYDRVRDVVIQTDARYDHARRRFTYWWAYTSDRLFDVLA